MFGSRMFSVWCAAAGIVAMLSLGAGNAQAMARPADQDSVDAFVETLRRIQDRYVDNVNIERLSETALKAAAGQLDRYSEYLSPAEYRALVEDTEGHFVGIGVSVERRAEKTIVLSVMPQSPALRAGILAGDEIVSVDGRLVRSLTLAQTGQLIRGDPGSTVAVGVQRAAWPTPKVLPIVRAMVDVDPVSSAWLADNMIYVRIDRFSEDTSGRLKDVIERSQKRARGVVIDLRDNGGGLFSEALAVADLFLREGVIVTTRGKGGKLLKQYIANRRSIADGLPIAILINQNTASAAEIVSVAMHDQRRAVLIGSKTFGKGSVQEVIELPNGGALKLTIARYYSPRGQSIDYRGVLPDLAIDSSVNSPPPGLPSSAALASDAAINRALQFFVGAGPTNSSAPKSGN